MSSYLGFLKEKIKKAITCSFLYFSCLKHEKQFNEKILRKFQQLACLAFLAISVPLVGVVSDIIFQRTIVFGLFNFNNHLLCDHVCTLVERNISTSGEGKHLWPEGKGVRL